MLIVMVMVLDAVVPDKFAVTVFEQIYRSSFSTLTRPVADADAGCCYIGYDRPNTRINYLMLIV
jgi:hypothetical protein